MQSEIMVYVIDDEPDVCRSIELLLVIEGIPSRSFASAEAFIKQAPHLPHGIVLSDIALSAMTGLELLQKLPSLDRVDPVILITGHGDVPLAVAALKSGAVDFIEKPFEADRLLNAVKDVRNAMLNSSSSERCIASLSRRERQVLKHIVAGMTAKQTAIALDISPRTVETYRQHLMEKTGASSLSQLIRLGIEAHIDERNP